MKVSLVSLRAEYGTSGERRSTLVVQEALQACGAQVHRIADAQDGSAPTALAFRNLFDFGRLGEISRLVREPGYDWHFVKIPTAAQLPLLAAAVGGASERLVVLLDSVCAGRGNAGSLLRELRHEPVYALSKRLINRPLWARLSRLRPRALVCSAQAQLAEARRLLGADRCHYRAIPNGSPEPEAPVAWEPREREPVVVGYLGHPYAYKGCLEVIESAPLLRESPRCVFRAAFSPSGRQALRERWLAGGGEDAKIVDAGRFLASIDILCAPLYTEFGTMVFPNVLLEAMRVGVPTVTTRSPVALELFGAEAPVGWLDEVTPAAIARAIRALLGSDLHAASARLRERYRLQFGRERTRQHWRELLDHLNGKGGA